MKVRDIIADKELPFPVIFECIEVNDFKIPNSIFKKQHVSSKYYQTSKLSCKATFKPLYISKNEK